MLFKTPHFLFPTLLLAIILQGCGQPEEEDSRKWYKGNLHTHSYWSDGDEFPEIIMDWYKSHGYHFVALTDHNIFAEGEKWVTINEDSVYQTAFQKYLKQYGEDWVNYTDEDGTVQVQLKTYAEYAPLFEEEERFLMIPAQEISDGYKGKPLHLNVTNLDKIFLPTGGESVAEVLQNNINAVLERRRETGQPMLVHINHPNFRWAITLQDIVKLKGERFFEVYNGHPQVHNMGDGLRMGTERMWDFINIAYIQKGQPLLYGLATDDSHNYHHLGREFSNSGRGWVMVLADSLKPGALIDALEEGDFYATTGVNLDKIGYTDNTLYVKATEESGVSYTIEFIGCREGERETEVLATVNGSEARFEVTPDLLFVRAKITSTRRQTNPVEDMEFEMAWVQPVRPS
ncbi:histidinol-phosphatase [Lunatimonas sp.]|uniref:histidinol-phosphatase n=1 Tax=Lunatimonas sp. TaxID=2060141 RepID=UPI00263B2EF8|nr:histidinol-phosphatase [Lunatimonas sp.]